MRWLSWLLLIVLWISCKKEIPPVEDEPWAESRVFYRGADFSFLPEIEAEGAQYYDPEGNPVDVLTFVKEQGVNLVRLRLFHSPADGKSGIEEVLTFAKRIKQQGLEILLNFHFSDTWADPAQQTMPVAWNALPFSELSDSVYAWSYGVMQQFYSEGISPKIVQIGNEVNGGFLWNEGRVGGSYDHQWSFFAALLSSAIDGVKGAAQGRNGPEIMIHYAGLQGIDWFAAHLATFEVSYDILGFSLYSLWHETDPVSVESKLQSLALNQDAKILVAETAHPWTEDWDDQTHNLYGQGSPLMSGFAASPQGQKEYVEWLRELLYSLPREKGLGFCYWAPDWVAFKGNQSVEGSAWENMAGFDFDHKALPLWEAFKE